MQLGPIPAFCGCYLLRSTVSRYDLYIGKALDPVNRLAQHNGRGGGAMATSKLRPWEMVCIVAGFPSDHAALQFEWAWQNPHLTRRIEDSQRLTLPDTITKINRMTERLETRPAPLIMSLADILSNLHLLLRVPSFARLPLEVRFFANDVYQAWLKWCDMADFRLPSSIWALLDLKKDPCVSLEEQAQTNLKIQAVGRGGVEGIDPSYEPVKQHIEKSNSLLVEGKDISCAVCSGHIEPRTKSTTLTCPNAKCHAAFHLTCLSTRFIQEEGSHHMLPIQGTCPVCKAELKWLNLVREMSLRLRGPDEVAELMKKTEPPKRKRGKARKAVAIEPNEEPSKDDQDEDDLDEGLHTRDVVSEPLRLDTYDDMMCVTSTVNSTNLASQSQRLEIVIEDSDWEGVEVLD